jgi:Protein of unknown function (DUF1573)
MAGSSLLTEQEVETQQVETNRAGYRKTSHRSACLVAAVVLLAAATMNLIWPKQDLGLSAYPPALVMLTVLVEIFIGCWLFVGWASSIAWMLSIFMFSTFSVLNVSALIAGQSDCGCFGSLKVHPGVTLLINLVVLGFLLLGHPTLQSMKKGWLATFLLVIGLAGSGLLARSEFGALLFAKIQGQELVLQTSVVDVGSGVVGEKQKRAFRVMNTSSRPINLIGGRGNCSCTAAGSLPIRIEANSSVDVEIEQTFKGTPGAFTHEFEFITDCAKQPKITGTVVGVILAAAP